jgi:hypothetical protein
MPTRPRSKLCFFSKCCKKPQTWVLEEELGKANVGRPVMSFFPCAYECGYLRGCTGSISRAQAGRPKPYHLPIQSGRGHTHVLQESRRKLCLHGLVRVQPFSP